MTDLTGPFKDFSTTLQAGHKMWVDEVNAAGGICGRQIALETLDHGYKADTATIQFPDMEPKVAGFMEMLGSPVIAALKTDINDKQVTTMAVSWSSELLDQPYVIIVGTTYDLEIDQRPGLPAREGRASRRATRSATSTSTASTAATACSARSTSPSRTT